MVDLASSRVVQKRWKARPRNVPATSEDGDDREQHGAYLFSRKPGDPAEGDEAGQEEEGPGDDRAEGQHDLEDRPDDERQAEDALEETRRGP